MGIEFRMTSGKIYSITWEMEGVADGMFDGISLDSGAAAERGSSTRGTRELAAFDVSESDNWKSVLGKKVTGTALSWQETGVADTVKSELDRISNTAGAQRGLEVARALGRQGDSRRHHNRLPKSTPMTGDAQILYDLGLLSWRTAEIGFRRGWTDGESIEKLADQALSQTSTTDSDLALLSGAGALSRGEIQEILSKVANRLDADADESTVLERWLLARLIGLRRESVDDGWLLDRVEETYAEFGFPEALDGVTRYDVTPEQRSSGLAVGDQATSPIEILDHAVKALQERLISGRG